MAHGMACAERKVLVKIRMSLWMAVLLSGVAGTSSYAAVVCTDASGVTFRAASPVGFELAGTRCAVERPPAIRTVVYGSSPYANDVVVVSLPATRPPDYEQPVVAESEPVAKNSGRPAYAALVERAA